METNPTIGSAEDWTAAQLSPAAGEGTLARLGRVVLLVGSTDAARVRPLLEQAEMVAANGGQGRQLVRGFALQLSTTADEQPAFVAMAPHDTGMALLVQGDATVTINGEAISGADSLAWVERLVPWPIEQLAATVDASAVPGSDLFRLTGGIVRSGGFAIGGADDAGAAAMPPAADATSEMPVPPPLPAAEEPPAAEPVETPAPPAAPAPPPPAPGREPAPDRPAPAMPADEVGSFDSVLLRDVAVDEDEPAPVPLPIVSEVADVSAHSVLADPAVQEEEVRGVFCKNRHFNDPRQLFCAVCGINMVQQTPVLVNGTRPPLGVLVLDDGAVFQLDSEYLLGRDPSADDRVRGGHVRGIPVQDQSNQISRVHARIELRGWDVVLIDNRSTNGTYLNPPKSTDWHRLPSGGEHVLTQGTRVRMGHRTLAFNTHAGQ